MSAYSDMYDQPDWDSAPNQDMVPVIQALVELIGVPTGQVHPPAALDEEGVARDQGAAHPEALGARRMTRGVQELDLDIPDPELVA